MHAHIMPCFHKYKLFYHEFSLTGWWFVTSEEGQGWVPSTYLQLPDGTQESHSVNNSTEDGENIDLVSILTLRHLN